LLAAASCARFCSRFTCTDGTVTHHIDVSLFPNWQGHDQVRRVTIEGGRLSIIASDRTAGDGRTFHSELTWLKV
jgi:hypothetical protein